jgi:DNA-binding MarR family transcriptional regulator
MAKGMKTVSAPNTVEGNFKKLNQLHRSKLYRVCLNRGLFVGQPGLLLTIRELGSCSQTELAAALDVTTPSVAVSIKRLEKNGLISKQINEKDNRYNKITLTKKGQQAAEKCEKIFECINNKMFNGFSADEKLQLNDMLMRMSDNLQSYDPEKDPTEQCPELSK